MNAQQFRGALDQLEAERVPVNPDLWPRLRAHLAARPLARWARWLPATRLGWIALVLAALLAVGATAHAATSTIGRLLRMFEPEAASQGDLASLGQPLSLSQTIDNVTVSVEWAYADAHGVRIGYTMRSSDGRRFDPANVRLADEAGAVMPFSMGYGVTGKSDILDVALPPGESSYVAVFANEAQSSAPGETLKLRLEMEAEELILPTPAPAVTSDPAGGPAGPGSELLEPLPRGQRLGPFTFEFGLPVAAGSR